MHFALSRKGCFAHDAQRLSFETAPITAFFGQNGVWYEAIIPTIRGHHPTAIGWRGIVELQLVMDRACRRFLVAPIWVVLCTVVLAQTDSTVAYLSQHPREMDGHLVRVRARFEAGWEGDNWLADEPGAGHKRPLTPPQGSGFIVILAT
jgi:hypothetical protein